jgi:hypothetical protein
VDYYLEPASLKPFSQLCELSAYASHLAYSEPMPPRVVYNQEMNTVSVDGEQVLLTELRAGVKNSIQSLRSRILDITSEDDIPNWTTGGTPVRDDPRDKTPRYSFLDDPRFSDAHLDLLKRLVQHSGWRIGLPDTTGRWMWNIPAILRFFSLTAGVQEVLMPLMQVASTAATRRGTEFSDTKIRNIPSRRRNICIQLGKVFNIAGYTKTSELTGHDSYLPAMLPEEISVPLVHYLAVVRPIECLLSRILWGEEVAALYASYLFIAQGQRLSSADDSVYLARFFKESCDADIRLNRWRQLAGSLTREFIDERFLTMNRRSDLGMGHSTATSRRNYGQDQDMAEFASSDAMFEQCWVDGEFHAILGLGSKPLPLAIRLRTAPTQVNVSAATVEPFQDALRAAISSLRQSIAEDVIGSLREVIRAEISTFVERFPGGSAEVMIPNSEQEDTFHVATFPDSEPASPESFSETFPDTLLETFSETSPETLLEASPNLFPDVTLTGTLLSAHKKHVDPGSKESKADAFQDTFQDTFPDTFPDTSPDTSPDTFQDTFQDTFPDTFPDTSPDTSPDTFQDTFREEEMHPDNSEPSSTLDDALRLLYGEGASPSSEAQRHLCIAVIEREKNVVAILPTGGGKSTAWLVSALVAPDVTTVVVVPFKELLNQHVKTAIGHGLNAMRWTATSGQVQEATNLLFLACESAKSASFSK